jgi:predicted RNase H-like HicB family nuclease
MKYPVYMQKDSESDYGVTVPDLPGCFSAGNSVEEALDNAEEAILTHIEGLLIDKETIPAPTPIEALKKGNKSTGFIWGIVSVDIGKLSKRAKRINLSLPEGILSKIDAYAAKEGESRSGFLAEAAIEYMARRVKRG